MRRAVALLALASLIGCGEPARVRVVAVYQEGDAGWGGGAPNWWTTLEIIETGERYRASGNLGRVGDEFNR